MPFIIGIDGFEFQIYFVRFQKKKISFSGILFTECSQINFYRGFYDAKSAVYKNIDCRLVELLTKISPNFLVFFFSFCYILGFGAVI